MFGAFPAKEDDTIPVQSSWIDQFILEALHYPSAAIRGSRNRGDRWIQGQKDDLRLHINGDPASVGLISCHPGRLVVSARIGPTIVNEARRATYLPYSVSQCQI